MFKCIYCKNIKNIENFISNNKIVKTCNVCREKNKIYQKENYFQLKQYKSEWHNKTKNERYFSILFNSIKNRSIKKNLYFDLDIDFLLSIDRDFCPYYLFSISNIINNNFSKSLDRINNDIGYIKGNVEFISNKANTIKNNSTISEQEQIIYWLENNNYIFNCNIVHIEKFYKINRLKVLYKNIKKRSKRQNIIFNISFEYFLSLLPPYNICPVLGVELFQYGKCFDPNLLSLDKINPNFGYIENNVAIISKKANTLKSYATLDELKIMVNRRNKLEENKQLYGRYIV